MIKIAPRNFYVRLSIPRETAGEIAHRVRLRVLRLVDFGLGTVQDRQECWLEIVHECADAGECLAHLCAIGVERAAVRECREIQARTGHLMARQPSLF